MSDAFGEGMRMIEQIGTGETHTGGDKDGEAKWISSLTSMLDLTADAGSKLIGVPYSNLRYWGRAINRRMTPSRDDFYERYSEYQKARGAEKQEIARDLESMLEDMKFPKAKDEIPRNLRNINRLMPRINSSTERWALEDQGVFDSINQSIRKFKGKPKAYEIRQEAFSLYRELKKEGKLPTRYPSSKFYTLYKNRVEKRYGST
jgi:hypothetical protein